MPAPSLRAVLAAALFARLLAVCGPLRFDDDVYRYLWDGAATTAGVSPYRFAPRDVRDYDPVLDPLGRPPEEAAALARLARIGSARRRGPLAGSLARINFPEYPTIYPPASELAFAASAAVAPGSDRAWRGLAAAADLAAVLLLVRLLALLGRPSNPAVGAAAYALHPLPILEFGAAGHQDALGIAALLGAALALRTERRALGGALLAVAAGVKLFPLALVEAMVALSPVVDPWYVPWALAAGTLRGAASWPVFALLVPLAYLGAPGRPHSPWLRLAAWGPFFLLLAREAWRARRAGRAAAEIRAE